jgi:hypothetical protein
LWQHHNDEPFTELHAMFVIVKGRTMPMDLSVVQTPKYVINNDRHAHA